ncbi:DUF4159 domain-containing protein [Shimia biformata]|uniref:DUF4159 domain-containing protein n=1 Tax=Shimia biformata TaxID=1294299 RepID=UPI00194EECD6|nr:DUF4159 domain-containing protein [Shimia biformata]
MFGLPIAFSAPWLLTALIALPVLWLILRAIPPAPVRRRFPGVALLLGLQDEDTVTDRTPWWLLLLRMMTVAAVIVGLAGPILNPDPAGDGDGPLLIVFDGGWASADQWDAHVSAAEAELAKAARQGREAAVINLADPVEVQFLTADIWRTRLAGLQPLPWLPRAERLAEVADALGDGAVETFWLSSGLEFAGRSDILGDLRSRGVVRVFQPGTGAIALLPPKFEDGHIRLAAVRAMAVGGRDVGLNAIGRDPGGNETVLATSRFVFDDGAAEAGVDLVLPSELRARITRFELAGIRSAGTVVLADDALQRREIALVAGRQDREGLQLLSPLHYLRQALVPTADVIEGPLEDVLLANPQVIVLADVAVLSDAESAALLDWAEAGGLLLRFAGPKLAASGVSRKEEDPLMPVRLRAGGRSVGGAMSWGEPKALAPFDDNGPFAGLSVPDEVRVTAQVMAQPDPTLADRVIAALSDGTPLVTRKPLGDGQVVLFHVTANAEWSGLPLSGLFVQMLDRLAALGIADRTSAANMEGTTWQPQKVLDGFGALQDGQSLAGVSGESILAGQIGPQLRPGLYISDAQRLAVNANGPDAELRPFAWPADVPVEGSAAPPARELGGLILGLALALLLADIAASLLVSGRLWGSRVVAVLALALALPPYPADAQEDTAVEIAAEVVFGHVLTGDGQVDQAAFRGLQGLSRVLTFRTSIEPATPRGVDLERDELALYPLLYWPISPDQPIPSDEAYARLNTYLRSGGMILFDTRDADVAGFGAASPNGRKLQRLALPLDIPALEPVPQDHVLTRTFYLLQDFPGRYAGRDLWVEAAPPDAEQIEGMPFRNLNDGVSPVVIGGNDWAAAWAIDDNGRFVYPVGHGRGGERQRELAYRFGVNLVMHVLTGNYKSDQVHVPALLERLGQ